MNKLLQKESKLLSNNKCKILVIVESPAKCLKIESYLGNDYKCIASYGHLRKLVGLEQIDINNNFATNYNTIDEPLKLKQIDKIRKEIEISSEVILATDDDREGEAIAWHICMLFDLPIKTTKRIIFHEITPTAIKHAIMNPTIVNINIVSAQRTRQILDLLVGFTICPILWNCFSKKYKNSLSAGRCQSVALRIIYDNYIEIKNNNMEYIYTTIGYFTNKNLAFELSIQFETEEQIIDFYNNSLEFNHIFSLTEPKQSISLSPEPLITSSLQQLASNELNMSPKETMKHAQSLYENGLITYMRTDNKKYSKEFIKEIHAFILKEYNDEKYTCKDERIICTGIDEKHDDSPHEAIRPVKISLKLVDLESKTFEKIESKAKKLYHLIWKRTMESCMSSCKSNYVWAEITASQGKYKYKSEQIIFPGWKKVENKYEEINPIYSYLLSIKQGIILDYKKITSTIQVKKHILHYTEARLVHLLEEMGIGRPSTFSSLVDKIQERQYVLKENIKGKKIKCKEYELEGDELSENLIEREFGGEKNKLVIQPVGIMVIEFLIKNFNDLFNYEYTKNMESELDIIATGKSNHVELCSKCYNEITSLVNNLDQSKYEVKIDDNHSFIIGKNGPVIKETINEKVTFKSVKKDIDLEKLKDGEYELEDLLDTSGLKDKKIGTYQGKQLYLKKGKYGLYVEWGSNKKSLKEFGNRPIENIDYIDVIKILEKDNLLNLDKPVGLIRELNSNLSIRTGQYGDYILFKNSKMKKPAFYKLANFKDDYRNCEKCVIIKWIQETYHLDF